MIMSNSTAVPGAPNFYVSSFSGGGNCVAVAMLSDGRTAVRHSSIPGVPILFGGRPWTSFIDAVKNGEFAAGSGAAGGPS
jgi:hypothetical protein